MPGEDGPPLEPGTYLISSEGRTGPDPVSWSITDYMITVPEGWLGHTGHYLSKWEDDDSPTHRGRGLGIYPVIVDEVYADPCRGETGPTVTLDHEPEALVEALLAQPGTAVSKPRKTTVGGRPATYLELEVPKGAERRHCHMADFGGPGQLQAWHSEPTGKYLVLMPGMTTGVYVVDVDGRRQVIVTGRAADPPDGAPARELQDMVDSIRFL